MAAYASTMCCHAWQLQLISYCYDCVSQIGLWGHVLPQDNTEQAVCTHTYNDYSSWHEWYMYIDKCFAKPQKAYVQTYVHPLIFEYLNHVVNSWSSSRVFILINVKYIASSCVVLTSRTFRFKVCWHSLLYSLYMLFLLVPSTPYCLRSLTSHQTCRSEANCLNVLRP